MAAREGARLPRHDTKPQWRRGMQHGFLRRGGEGSGSAAKAWQTIPLSIMPSCKDFVSTADDWRAFRYKPKDPCAKREKG